MRRRVFLPVIVLVASCGACVGVARFARPARYEAELLSCVAEASTEETSRACRYEVMRRYGRLDAGPSAPSDGGER